MVDEHFLKVFEEEIKLSIEDYVGKKCSVKVQPVDKNNITMTALSILPEGSVVGTVIYVDPYYEASRQQVTTQTLIKKALESIKKGIEDAPTVDLNMIRDYEQVKGRLSVDLMSADNTKILKSVPHQLFEDMAAVYRINLDWEKMGGTVLITNQMLEVYGITPEQLHADAIHNAEAIKPVCISNLFKFLRERDPQRFQEEWGDEVPLEEDALYVATVPDKMRGAGVLLYENFFEDAAKIFGGDFYIIPSSVHEVLLAKDVDGIEYSKLKQIVKEVNNTQVEPEDRLTYSVYHYDTKNHIFERGNVFEDRRSKELEAEQVAKGSVLRKLKEKQAESKYSASKVEKEACFNGKECEVL